MNNNLNNEQQSLINMYINQYNITNTHIEQLFLFLDDIRSNIFNIMIENHTHRGINRGINRDRGRVRTNNNPRNTNTNSNTNTNTNSNSNTQYRGFNPYVRYDYNRPISPSVYNDYTNNNNNNNIRNSVNALPTNIPMPSLNVIPPIPTTRPIIDSYTTNEATTLLNTFLNTTVVVRPTNAQIQQASRLIIYGDIENPLSQSCPISLEDFNEDDQVSQILYCGHIFHTHQFQQWFESNVRCPVCRYDIRNYRSTISEETKEETHFEESKEELPFDSSINQTNLPVLERRISNTLNQVTENLLGQLFNQQPINRINPQQFQYFDIITYDLSFNI